MTRLLLILLFLTPTQLFAQQSVARQSVARQNVARQNVARQNVARQKPPNVIIFFADDLRANALGCYGNSYIQTPTIDSLARNGVKFTNAYIQGSHHGALCAPSRAMLLTSKSYHRIKDKMKGHLTIAKQLRDVGYTTYMTGKWHNEREVVEESFDYARNVMFGGMSDHFKVYTQDLKPDRTFTDIEYKGFSTDIFSETMVDFVNQPSFPKSLSLCTYHSQLRTTLVRRCRSTLLCTTKRLCRYRQILCRLTRFRSGIICRFGMKTSLRTRELQKLFVLNGQNTLG
jgi:hypothetical protein